MALKDYQCNIHCNNTKYGLLDIVLTDFWIFLVQPNCSQG
uniref:Uncharacterized protein n=1 Tax=Tetranychus urticae TaxID=32264 RepID=T1K295_TETUR